MAIASFATPIHRLATINGQDAVSVKVLQHVQQPLLGVCISDRHVH